jgi:hypothetical protein
LWPPSPAISALIEMKSAPAICFDQADSQSFVPAGKSRSTVSAPRMFGLLSARGAEDPAMEPMAARPTVTA